MMLTTLRAFVARIHLKENKEKETMLTSLCVLVVALKLQANLCQVALTIVKRVHLRASTTINY
jgi:hypothetical protein